MDRVKRIMEREVLDGIILFNPFNIRYLTGYNPSWAFNKSVAILSRGTTFELIVPQLERELVKHAWVSGIQTYSNTSSSSSETESSTLVERIRETIENLDLASAVIGIELDFVTARWFEELKRLFPDAGFKDISSMMMELRMTKDEAEIERLSTALQIAERGMRTALEVIQPGITEIEVASEVEYTLRKAGATGTGFPTVIASGPRSDCLYAQASSRVIGVAELVVIGLSAVYQDYCSNVARTVITGQPDKKQRHLFESARASITLAIDQLVPGIAVCDIANMVLGHMDEQGYGASRFDMVGHSIGLQPWEAPIFTVDDDTPVLPGQVFCISSGSYLSGVGGVFLSSTLVHQRNGSFTLLNEVPLHTV